MIQFESLCFSSCSKNVHSRLLFRLVSLGVDTSVSQVLKEGDVISVGFVLGVHYPLDRIYDIFGIIAIATTHLRSHFLGSNLQATGKRNQVLSSTE
jgi:hypothetical protein